MKDEMSLDDEVRSVVILPDVHLTDEVPKDYLPVKRFIRATKPDKIILLGDFMDVSALSAWDMDKKLLMENRRYKSEVHCANKELDFLQRHCDDIVYLEGNHEDRVNRYIEKNPEMQGLIELPEQLNLKKRHIKWVEMNKLHKVGDMYFTHGMFTNIHNARKHLQTLGCNVCYGHQHSTQTAMQNMAMQKPYMAYALGTLGDKKPDYLKNRPGNWINQFAVMYYKPKGGNFNLFPINIIKGQFMWEGKVWK